MSERYAIVCAQFYPDLAERLTAGAQAVFAEAGCEPAETFELPGAFELPAAAKFCAQSGRFAGVACLGAVIRGETDHYDYVCAEAARGIQSVSLETGVQPTFIAARALYYKAGFVDCPPFEGYVEDPNSLFMTKTLG